MAGPWPGTTTVSRRSVPSVPSRVRGQSASEVGTGPREGGRRPSRSPANARPPPGRHVHGHVGGGVTGTEVDELGVAVAEVDRGGEAEGACGEGEIAAGEAELGELFGEAFVFPGLGQIAVPHVRGPANASSP